MTGGANGIGLATARRLLASNARVAIWDRDIAAGESAVAALGHASGRLAFFPVDVTDGTSVDDALVRTADRFGGVDILINNAGIIRDAQLVKVSDGAVVDRMSDEAFDAVIAVNLKGVFTCTRAVVPYLLARGGGRIVNASSVVAANGNFGQSNYVASKTGVEGMTKVWAREFGRRGITVNAVAPGFIATDMAAQTPANILAQIQLRTPLGRLGTPDDVANAYCFLVSDAATFINGAVLAVDGGLVIGS